MPKETIHGGRHAATIDNDHPQYPIRVDVAWGRDHEYVQLSTLTRDGFGIKTVDPESPDGLWASLGRADINRLITVLRKARDQAYGADQ